MPVFPAVPSTIVPPGLILRYKQHIYLLFDGALQLSYLPFSSASLITPRAALSFTLPPGFWNSAFPKILQPVLSDKPFK